MTDLQKTIEIIFSGVDEMSKPISNISSGVEDFATNVQDVAEPVADLGKKVLALQAAFMTLAGGAIAMAIKESAEFNAGIAEINTILSLGSGELDAYSKDVQEYAQNSTQSIDQILLALYNASSLGVEYADSLDVMATAEKLAVGTKTDLNSALETLIGTMNAYGAPMTEITRYSDAFFTIIKDGKTTLPELSQAIANTTGIAASAGINFETLGAAIAGLTAAGAPTSQAITQIKSAIQALAAPTPAAAQAAEDLGISLGSAAIESKGLPGVLNEIYEATGGNVEEMRKLVPSIEGMQAALILGADNSGVFSKALEDMANKTGATEAAFDQMAENSNLIWQNMTNNWKVMLAKFGDELEGSSRGLVSSFSDLWESISDSIDNGTFDPVLDLINDFMESAEQQIALLAKNLPEALAGVDFEEFVKAMTNLKEAVFDFLGMDLSNEAQIKKTLQNLVDSFASLTNLSAAMVKAFEPVGEAAVELAEWFNGLDESTQDFIGTAMGISMIVAPLAGATAAIAALVGAIGTLAGVVGAGSALATGVSGLIALLTGPAGLAIALGIAAAAIGKFSLDKLNAEQEAARQKMEETNATIMDLLDQVRALPANIPTVEIFTAIEAGEFERAQAMLDELTAEDHESKVKARVEQKEFLDYWDRLSSLPAEKQTELLALINAGDEEAIQKFFEDVESDKTAPINPELDQQKTDAAGEDLSELEKDRLPGVIPQPDAAAFNATKSAINEIPESKLMEIELKGEIQKELAQIETTAEMMQTAFEWSAKVDIAQIEAAAKVTAAAFDSVGESVSSTAAAAADMFSSFMDNIDKLSMLEKHKAWDVIRDQMAMEREALAMQRDLIDAQVDYMQAKADALRDGDGLIKIESDGLEPALEMIMWQILEKVQLRVNEESAEFLLGLNS